MDRLLENFELNKLSGSKLKRYKNPMACFAASFDNLSLEILVKIMSSLSLRDILVLETISKKLSNAVAIHLRTRKSVDFTEGKWYGEMSPLITDGIFSRLLKRCPEVNTVLGIHPTSITKRQQRHSNTLSVDGITSALTFCPKLKSIGTSNVQVLEAMLAINPSLEIAGVFRNRGGRLSNFSTESFVNSKGSQALPTSPNRCNHALITINGIFNFSSTALG